MSDAASISTFRPWEIRQATCENCGKVVRIPDIRPKEIKLWWPIPLAAIIWLAIILNFGRFLKSPEAEMPPLASIEASFVEMSDDKPTQQAKSTKTQSKPRPKPAISDESHLANIAAPVSPIEPSPVGNIAPPTDLMAYLKVARARDNAAEMAAKRENDEATARERGPSADEIRMANIRRNLQPRGTNGLFRIISVGSRTGMFSFRGWTNDYSDARRETIEVDAGPSGDVEHAMVRRMIEMIRKYYKGDFNWESQRLGRVLSLSARIEDNAGLEDVLMREFFEPGVRR